MNQMSQPSTQFKDEYSTDTPTHLSPNLPDHTQLPDEDGKFVKNYQEPPQGDLLTHCITPILQQRHPDGNYCIGRDCGIYWRLPDPPESPDKGAEAPDWFYVPNVSPTINGEVRRSFVLWKETAIPLIALEFVSGNGSEERDQTPIKGKFWVYERAIQIPFYGIYEVKKAKVEVYQLINGRYQNMTPNKRGHYPIELLNLELGIWQGEYQNQSFPWLRWWDSDGNLLLTPQEQMEREKQRANRLEEQLRALGIEPEI
ncbi:MAG: Uma2 family endonuclease [Microcystaceae cyanobacterium]